MAEPEIRGGLKSLWSGKDRVGSTPTPGTKVIETGSSQEVEPQYNRFGCGSSSVVERLLAKEKVAGSSPVSRSIKRNFGIRG